MATDDVDRIVGQWAELRPDLDASPMAIWGRISRLELLASRAIGRTLAEHDLHPSEFDVLATLARHGGALRPLELRNGMMVGSGTMTHRIDLLERAGLVERTPDVRDRRGRVVVLTEAGRRVVDAAVEEHLATEAAMLEGVPAAVIARLARDLATLLAAVGEHAAQSASEGTSER